MKGLIITGGSMDLTFAISYIKNIKYNKIIAVDGGLAKMKALGLCPDYIVGDFDTVSPEVRTEFESVKGIHWERHKPEKDEVDTQLAIDTAIHAGCKELVILGATGGRMDHTLANIQLLLYSLKQGVVGQLIDKYNRIYLLHEGRQFYKHNLFGTYISFIPLTTQVTGVTLTGFRYPLTNYTLRIGESLAISNELAGENAQITFKTGILICMETRD